MKKFVVLLLLLVYGSATMGATIHVHYCMNQLVGWSLIDSNDHPCQTCGMEKKGSCCKDSKAQIKLAADQQKSESSASANFNSYQFCLFPIVSDYLQIASTEPEARQLISRPPPLLPYSASPEFLCVFKV